MAETFQFELVAPEEIILSEAAEMVTVPGGDGDYGVLPRHAPMITTVRTGVLSVYEQRRVRERIFVAGGFAEVTPKRLTVLVEEAVNLEKVNRADVEQSLKNARDELADAADASNKMHLERRIGIETVKLKALS
ncbi:MAG: ATP synthase F1 subunit epsilon [Rhodospirillales bacterium]|nr:ATP synthase F1 subunit epsilon [Rhodospirillales bacterium]